jgi:hypothetical protein
MAGAPSLYKRSTRRFESRMETSLANLGRRLSAVRAEAQVA